MLPGKSMRHGLVLLLTLFAPFCLFSNDQVAGVETSVRNLDLLHNSATIQIINNSDKDITGYAISFAAVYTNGEVASSERIKDYGPALTRTGDILHPGHSSEESYKAKVRPGNPLVRIDARVAAVVYADQTADAPDLDALGRIQDHRTAAAITFAKMRDIVERSLADQHPNARASGEIKELLKSPATSTGIDRVYLRELSDELDRAQQNAAQSGPSERDYLSQRLSKLQHDAAEQSRYAQITRRKP